MSPCNNCTPADDKEILFIRGTYPSTDPRLTWDYTQQPPLLSVGGKVAASGSIATSSEVDGSFFSPKTLGSGSFNFTPQAGYGGLLYRGGSMFYYWNDALNSWQPLDFAGHVSSSVQIIAGPGLLGGGPLTSNVTLSLDPNYELISIYHNGVLTGKKSSLNFTDSVSVSWGISSNGVVNVTAFGTGGGAWIANVNANNFSINNLNSINGIPVSLLCTNPFNRNVLANGYDLTQVGNETINGNLSVGGTLTYKGQPIEDLISGGGLWSLNADGSIYRSSNVTINGANSPLVVNSNTASNFLYLNTQVAANGWSAYAVEFNGVYSGELGWGQTQVELWTKTSLILRGFETGSAVGNVFFPGLVGIGTQAPAQKLDVVGNVNASNCFLVNEVSFACNNGTGGITVAATTISTSGSINSNTGFYVNNVLFASNDGAGGVVLSNVSGGFAQSPWVGNVDGGGHSLSNVGSINSVGLVVGASGASFNGNVNVTNGCYYLSAVSFACANGIGGVNLSNIALINGQAPGAGGSGGAVSQGGLVTGRQIGVSYQNATGKPVFVYVSLLFNTPGEVVAFTGPTSPPGGQVTRVNTGTGFVGTIPMGFVVLPGQFYGLYLSAGTGGAVEDWAEWW